MPIMNNHDTVVNQLRPYLIQQLKSPDIDTASQFEIKLVQQLSVLFAKCADQLAHLSHPIDVPQMIEQAMTHLKFKYGIFMYMAEITNFSFIFDEYIDTIINDLKPLISVQMSYHHQADNLKILAKVLNGADWINETILDIRSAIIMDTSQLTDIIYNMVGPIHD